jgi:hypothetical protein
VLYHLSHAPSLCLSHSQLKYHLLWEEVFADPPNLKELGAVPCPLQDCHFVLLIFITSGTPLCLYALF